MIRRPPRSTLCPDTTLFRALGGLFIALRQYFAADADVNSADMLRAVEVLTGFSLGAESIALFARVGGDRKSTRLNSSHANISYAVFCLTKTIREYIF